MTTIGGCVGLLLPCLIGFLLLWRHFPQIDEIRDFRRTFVLCCSICIGMGIVSLLFFLSLFIKGSPDLLWMVGSETLVLVFLITMSKRTWAQDNGERSPSFPSSVESSCPPNVRRLLFIGFGVALILACCHFLFRIIENPHGEPDAFYLWNTCARFIFRAQSNWKFGFSEGGWSHPDYPLLLPGNIVRMWSFVGKETVFVPILFAFLFTFGSIGILVSGLSILRGTPQGLLGSLFLFSTPYFIKHGVSQYADIPFGCYVLLTLVLLTLHDQYASRHQHLLALIGLTVGFAAWTKNEGMLFLLSVITARLLAMLIMRTPNTRFWKENGVFIVGIFPILCIIGVFKFSLAPRNDLFALQNISRIMMQLTDIPRYLQVGKAFLRQCIEPYSTVYSTPIIVLLLYVLFAGIHPHQYKKMGVMTSGMTLLFMYSGYFFIYIFTPHDLAWHLGTSLSRLWLQLYPGTIFVMLLCISTPYERKGAQKLCS